MTFHVGTFCNTIKIHTYEEKKSVAFLYANNEQVEKEIRKIIPFTIP
jgi:hypothetical protein